MNRAGIAWANVLLLALVTSCEAGSPPTARQLASRTAEAAKPSPQRPGVVLVALHGAHPDSLLSYMEDGTMPNLASLAERGVVATSMQTVDPALSAPSYVSLSTGAYPSETGVVSDKYSTLGRPFAEPSDPLDPLDEAPETVWRTAMRNGLKTATLFWPSASMDEPEQHANYMVSTSDGGAPSAQHVLTLQEADDWIDPPPSVSPLRDASLRITSSEGGILAKYNLLAVDQAYNNPGHYDLLIVDNDRNLANGHVRLALGSWAAVTVSPRLHSGTHLCFTASEGMTVTVYQSRVSYVRGRPDALVQEVNGFHVPPPVPDIQALQRGWLSPQQYMQMAKHRSEWMTDVLLHVYRAYQPDLLLTAQNIVDEGTRAFGVVNGLEEEHASETATAYAAYRRQAHSVADATLGQLLSQVDLADSVVLVVSGSTVMSTHSTVRVNTILKDAGLLAWQNDGSEIDAERTSAVALAAGGSAHVYVNLLGRDRPGLVAPEDYENVLQRIVRELEQIVSEDGEPVFARILRHEELPSIHLDSPNSGDVFVQAAPGYCLSDELGRDETLALSATCAAGGFDATLANMQGAFIAAGDGLAAGKRIPHMHVIDVAPTIAQVLRFQPATTVSGSAPAGVWDQ